MAKVSIASGYEPGEVDLWGSVFHTKPETRSVQKAQRDVRQRLETEEDDDKAVALIGELLDVRLAPSDGKRTKPSALIIRKWEADELTIHQLMDFLTDLEQADRPS